MNSTSKISYPDLLMEIVKDKERLKNTTMNRRERKLFRRAINKKVELFNNGIKVLKCGRV